jgi:tetratricopeptide (TPR) repeat protein
MIYLDMERLDEAEKLFEEILGHDANHIEAWINYSVSKSITSGLDKAIEIIEESLEKNKEDASLWLRLAAYLYQSGKVQQAFFYIENALKIDPNSSEEILEYMPDLREVPRFVELIELYKIKD